MPVNRDVRNLDTLLRHFFLVLIFFGLTIKYHYHKKELYEKQQLKSWMSTNGLEKYTDSFLEHGIKNLRDLAIANNEKEISQIIFEDDTKNIHKTLTKAIDRARFKTWLLDNDLEHLEIRFKEMGITTLMHVVDKLAELKELEFLDAYHALFSLETNKDKLQSYNVFHKPSFIKLVVSWLWFFTKLSIFVLIVFTGFSYVFVKYFLEMVFMEILGRFISAFFEAMTRGSQQNVRFRPPQLPRLASPLPRQTNPNNFFRSLFQSFFRNNNRRTTISTSADSTPARTESTSLMDTILFRKLSHRLSSVTWKSTSFCVGEEMVLCIKLVSQNGCSYKSSKLDSIKCEVQYKNKLIESAMVYSKDTESEIFLHFTPTVSNVAYEISILANAQHVGSSPISSIFDPGEVDAQKSSLVVPSSLLLMEQRRETKLTFDERDKFGNIVISDVENLLKYSFVFFEFHENGQQVFPRLAFAPREGLLNNTPNEAYLTLYLSGTFTIDVFYDGQAVSEGVTILVLTREEMKEVDKNVSSTSYNLYYEARVFSECTIERKQNNSMTSDQVDALPDDFRKMVTSVQSVDPSKKKIVYCYLSPKFFSVKEFYMRFFQKRQQVIRIKPSVQIQLHYGIFEGAGPSFTIQPPFNKSITIHCAKRNVVVGTFIKFLLKSIGGSEKFEDKRNHFYLLHRKQAPSHSSSVNLKIRRSHLLKDSMQATKDFSKKDWCKRFIIRFDGEEGLDYGGLGREWSTLVLENLFNTRGGLFQRFNKEDRQALVHPNPQRSEDFQKFKWFEFAGQVVGKCLNECACNTSRQQYVKARFTRSFLAQILGLGVSWKHFETDDKQLYIGKIKYIYENDPDGLDIFFSEDVYDGKDRLVKTVDLKPGGSQILVTQENKMEYIQLVAQYRLQDSVKEEIAGFVKGLHSIVDENMLSMFDENELELLMCGMEHISVADMKANCDYPYMMNIDLMDQFWSILSGFSQEELSRLLQFITGSSQLPPEGFAGLAPKLRITFLYTQDQLPISHTCSNHLVLSMYSSIGEFRRKLHYAITEGCEGFGLV